MKKNTDVIIIILFVVFTFCFSYAIVDQIGSIKINKPAVENSNLKYPNLVGKWKSNNDKQFSILNGIVRIYEKDSSYYISIIFDKDGSEMNSKLNKVSYNRFNEIGKTDYYIINNNGDLEVWDQYGRLYTSKRIN